DRARLTPVVSHGGRRWRPSTTRADERRQYPALRRASTRSTTRPIDQIPTYGRPIHVPPPVSVHPQTTATRVARAWSCEMVRRTAHWPALVDTFRGDGSRSCCPVRVGQVTDRLDDVSHPYGPRLLERVRVLGNQRSMQWRTICGRDGGYATPAVV